MGEFHNAVSTLLDAFASAIAVIKTQRRQRKKERIVLESPHKVAETHLSKSLKKNRADVKNAYGRDIARFGKEFKDGDAEARFSLSAILHRLVNGFVSIIQRFTRGRSTPADYQALLNLSNASRLEAINTFEQLSKRLSTSSLSLGHPKKPSDGHDGTGHRRKANKTPPVLHTKHIRSKSAPELSLTPLGPATSEGWVRPKHGRTLSSDSKSSKSSSSQKRRSPKRHSAAPQTKARGHGLVKSPPTTPVIARSKAEHRKSFMSFASDSTKLGEIPEHKWATSVVFGSGDPNFPVTTYYPLEPYQEPEKQRSRFMRLFRR